MNVLETDIIPILKTDEWNKETENLVKNIGQTCKMYKDMHLEASRLCEKYHTMLMYTGIILGPIAGLISGIGISVHNYIEFPIISGFFSFLSGIIMSIIKASSFECKSLSHKTTSGNYANLENNIRRQLCLYRKDRVNPVEYSIWISKSYDEIYNSAPLVPTKMHDKYISNIEDTIIISEEIDLSSSLYIQKDITVDKYSDKLMEYELKRMMK